MPWRAKRRINAIMITGMGTPGSIASCAAQQFLAGVGDKGLDLVARGVVGEELRGQVQRQRGISLAF